MTMDGHGLLSNVRSPRLYHQRRVLLNTSKVEQYLRVLLNTSRIEQYLCVLLNTSKAEQYLLNVTLDHSPTPTITDRWTNFVQVLHLFAWSKVQHSGTEENRREESTCLPRGQQVHGTQCFQGQIPKSSAPRIAIVLLSPSPALGMGSFYFWGFFLASIKIVV